MPLESSGADVRGWRRRLHAYRTEGAGPVRHAVAIGLGVFVGCLPLYGLHLALCLFLGWLLGLNRVKLYLAANISNPVMMPFLLLAEVQAGAWVRTGAPHALTLETARAASPWLLGIDLLVGAMVVAVVLGLGTGVLTYAALGQGRGNVLFNRLAERAAERYVTGSLTGWEFANAKLRSDPVYEAALCGGLLPSGGTLVDIGCGQGLMLALLAEARTERPTAHTSPLPAFDHLFGIETRASVAQLAGEALGADADIVHADATTLPLPACSAAVIFDVLHMIPHEQQVRLLSAVRAALCPGGILLVREADPTSGWRFALVRTANRTKALAGGTWRQPFCFRHPDDWLSLFRQTGFDGDRHAGDGPLGNVLFRLTATDGRP